MKPSKPRNAAPSLPLLLSGVALAALCGGALLYGCRQPAAPDAPPTMQARDAAPDAPPRPEGGVLPGLTPTPPPAEASAPDGPREVTVYRVATNGEGSHLTPETVRVSGDSDEERAAAALNAMDRYGKDSPLPPGAKARSVKIDGGTATVDYDGAFVKNFAGGDENEALVLNAVTAVLGQFAGVKRVQVTVDGKKIDTLGGTESLTEPIPVPQTVDHPQQTASSDRDGGDD